MRKILFTTLFLAFVLGGNSQKSEITIHNKNQFVTQTGFLIDGYKQGKWTNIGSRNDTSYSFYEKDRVTSKTTTEINYYGPYKNKKIVKKHHFIYSTGSFSNDIISNYGDEIYSITKNTNCYHSSYPYFQYNLSGDSRTSKTIYQKLELGYTVNPLKEHFSIKHDQNLKSEIPTLNKVEFNIDETSGFRSIKNLTIYYKGKNIESGIFELDGDSYKTLISDNLFFKEKSSITLLKNEIVIFKEEFYKGVPTSIALFYDNGNEQFQHLFKDGIPDGDYNSFYENGNPMVVCKFEQGVLQGGFSYYQEDKTPIFTANFVDGKLEGIVEGMNQTFVFNDGKMTQSIIKNKLGEVTKWSSINKSYTVNYSQPNLAETRMDGVKYTYDREVKRYSQFGYGSGEINFGYTDYGKSDYILVNYSEDKHNYFSVYITKKGEVKDDIGITIKGINYRDKSKKEKLKLIKAHFINVKKLKYPDVLKISRQQVGDTIIKSTFLPNGIKCLEEKFVNGKHTGKRLMWDWKGNLIQEINYVDNLNEGKFASYNSSGEILEAGNYKNGTKNGEWIKIQDNKKSLSIYANSFKPQSLKTYFESGKIKASYNYTDSGKYTLEYLENGKLKSDFFNTNTGKQHGDYFGTWGNGKSVKGHFLNGYEHGKFSYFSKDGELEDTKIYDYGRIINTEVKNTLNSTCDCPPEFNVRKGAGVVPTLQNVVSYSYFNKLYPNTFEISEKDYNNIFMSTFRTEHSGDNMTKWISFNWMSFTEKNAVKLAKHKDVSLILTPCKKPEDRAFRNINFNIVHRLPRYISYFDSEDDEFEMTSKNMFELLVEMTNLDAERFVENNFYEQKNLVELIEYLNKNKFEIKTTEDHSDQRAIFNNYFEENDKDDEFKELIFLKYFNHGELDLKKNPEGFKKFENNIYLFFDQSYQNITIRDIKEGIIDINADIWMEGGRYALSHPKIIYDGKATPLFFNCKAIKLKEKITFDKISNICIQPNTQIEGTKFEILTVETITVTNEEKQNKLSWNCKVKHPGLESILELTIEFDKTNLTIEIMTYLLSDADKELLKKLYKSPNQSVQFIFIE